MRVTPDLQAQIKAAAAKDGRTISDWLLRVTEAALRRTRGQ